MNLTWHPALLLPSAEDFFTPVFYRNAEGKAYVALLPGEHSNKRIVIVTDPKDPRTLRIVSPQLAVTLIYPCDELVSPDEEKLLNAVCEAHRISRKFITFDDDSPADVDS